MAGTVVATGDHWLIRFERPFGLPQDRVWTALVGPGQMNRWFDRTEMPVELKLGLVIRFVHERLGLQSLGLITALDPPRLIQWEWSGPFGAPSTVRWALAPDGDRCIVTLTQTIEDPSLLARTLAGWDLCLDRLDAVLTGQSSSAGGGRWPALFDDYRELVATLGIAAEQQGAPPSGATGSTGAAPPSRP
ncbi:MAG TPA: SRPBCC domain-containing protein [Caulobacteraceae bacterium]|nr:SRPBCC domain-containing protein [Caulobacteraceae bacterium]